jgi:hypothetical protein
LNISFSIKYSAERGFGGLRGVEIINTRLLERMLDAIRIGIDSEITAGG